ncbi:polysaccharide biosynthesis protein [Micromonospora endolithica]|uniref:Polysaccharide biosynthesis protein n=1 Tax=Micromonospora endolithica TaxID=230091 RepID=A0A3A9YNT1_9ACTN|nr:polysaccharide biosynthesis protein [Micromonospora endolithica]RKN37723.1 polysaccharide biosynthesis protein [Micromonospora endolithica]TWJ25318.1 O-antigen/teichoic acid export membrane protein [Micromonospora endolithica]
MTQTAGGATAVVRLGAAGAAVTVATVLTNALAYAVPVLGARRLTPADLGALATVLALAAIAAVPGFGLQIAVAAHRARRGATDPARLALRTAAVTAGLTALAAPVLSWTLRLPLTLTLLLAASTFATVLAGRRLGELQGDQRFLRLAAAMTVLAAGRYGGLVVGLALGRSPVGCLLLGTVTGLLVLPLLARLARPAAPARPGVDAGAVDELRPRQVLTACAASLAMLTISYADLILARQLLSADASGGYAVGSVLTKGALWAPQVVTLLVLPRLARGDRQARAWALGLILACGAVLVGASVVAGDLAFRLAGGAAYLHLAGEAPLFAAVGALYAVVFMLVNDRVATGARWPGAPLWAAAGLLGLTALLAAPRTVPGVLACALGTAVLTAVVMAWLALRPARR